MHMIAACVLFMIVYVFIVTEIVEKTTAVLLGAFCMFLFRIVPFEYAMASVDLNVIFLLVGMMSCVFVLSKTGFFEWIAIFVAKKAKGNPLVILLLLMSVTAVLSSVLDNVTTIILIAPITILIMEILEISPVPFLILEVLASNIGGTATLIGDPPNILIGLQARLTFNDFLTSLGPIIVAVFIVFTVTVFLVFRKRWHVPDEIKQRVTAALPELAIVDRPNMIRAICVLAVIFIGFFTQELTGLEPGIVALSGGMIMLIVCRSEVDATFMKVEWGVIFFFIGLFIIVSGLEYTGVIKMLANNLIHLAGTNLFLLCMIILFASAVFSSIMDNIPFVITIIPLIKEVITVLSVHYGIMDPALIKAQIAQPLWWSLALGACLGGNGTLIGASANVVMSKISERNNHPVSFIHFFRYGSLFMAQSIIVAAVFLWLRYFR